MSKRRQFYVLFLMPSLVGMLLFFLLPYLASFHYAFSPPQGSFAGLSNFHDVLTSISFRTAIANTVRFMAICVPLNVAFPFILAWLIHHRKKNSSWLIILFMFPLVIPTGASVYFWKIVFGEYGVVNRVIFLLGGEGVHWFQSEAALWVVIIAFLCKNIGFNMVLLLTGLRYIPQEYYEVAFVEGAGQWKTMRKVTLVYLSPSLAMTFLMSIINSFKIFREIYLLFGNYPYKSIYMLQHYMNNQFFAANLQKLSVASTVISLVITVVVLVLIWGQKQLMKNIEE